MFSTIRRTALRLELAALSVRCVAWAAAFRLTCGFSRDCQRIDAELRQAGRAIDPVERLCERADQISRELDSK